VNLFSQPKPPQKQQPRQTQQAGHSIVIRFRFGQHNLEPIAYLEGRIMAALKNTALGAYAGSKMEEDYSHGFLYLQGPDADALFAAIKPELEKNALMDNAEIRLRYGPLNAQAEEKVVSLKNS
jgi:hypothetical protein